MCDFEHGTHSIQRKRKEPLTGYQNPLRERVGVHTHNCAVSVATEPHCGLQGFVFPHLSEELVANAGMGEGRPGSGFRSWTLFGE